MSITVRDVLALPELQHGAPEVLTGDVGLGNPVRWVHVSELADIAYLLHGGELILTTGIALPTADRELVRYIDDLAAAAASGVVIELGRRFDHLPACLVEAARRRGLPLVALEREIRFVQVTEAVHGLIINAQLRVLQASERIHRTFTDLSTEGASPQEIVPHIATLAGCPVVLENLAHQVIAYDAAHQPEDRLLEDWERRSRLVRNCGQTEHVTGRRGRDSWLVSDVSARGEKWGRLLMAVAEEPSTLQVSIIERGATALALNRLIERDRETLERQSHRSLLSDIRSGSYSSTASVALRAQSLGVPLVHRSLTGIVVHVALPQPSESPSVPFAARNHAELLARAARDVDTPALVGVVDKANVEVVLSLDPAVPVGDVLVAFSQRVHRAVLQSVPTPQARIGVGSTVESVRELRRSLIEAEQVVTASLGMDEDKLYYALPDIRIRGLLYLLRDDPRLQVFVEHELAPLLMHDQATDADLTRVLRVYLEHGGNKSSAAAELQMSRPAFYQRLEQIEAILLVDLDDMEPRLSLHVGLLALDAVRSATT